MNIDTLARVLNIQRLWWESRNQSTMHQETKELNLNREKYYYFKKHKNEKSSLFFFFGVMSTKKSKKTRRLEEGK